MRFNAHIIIDAPSSLLAHTVLVERLGCDEEVHDPVFGTLFDYQIVSWELDAIVPTGEDISIRLEGGRWHVDYGDPAPTDHDTFDHAARALRAWLATYHEG